MCFVAIGDFWPTKADCCGLIKSVSGGDINKSSRGAETGAGWNFCSKSGKERER